MIYYELVTQCDVRCLAYIVQLEHNILLWKHSLMYQTLHYIIHIVYFLLKSTNLPYIIAVSSNTCEKLYNSCLE